MLFVDLIVAAPAAEASPQAGTPAGLRDGLDDHANAWVHAPRSAKVSSRPSSDVNELRVIRASPIDSKGDLETQKSPRKPREQNRARASHLCPRLDGGVSVVRFADQCLQSLGWKRASGSRLSSSSFDRRRATAIFRFSS